MINLAPHTEIIARRLLGVPNPKLSTGHTLRFGRQGSIAVEINGQKAGSWFDHETNKGGGLLQLIEIKGGVANGHVVDWLYRELGIGAEPRRGNFKIVAAYNYCDEKHETLYQVCRLDPKDFRQRRPNGRGGFEWGSKGIRRVPYRLPELLAADPERAVFVAEGEKDVQRLVGLGLVATTNAGGAGKWPHEFSEYFRGRALVAVLPDNDDAGRRHAHDVAVNLAPVVGVVAIVELPGLPVKGDVSDWLDAGHTRQELEEIVVAAEPFAAKDARPEETASRHQRGDPADAGEGEAVDADEGKAVGVDLDDFYALMPSHDYIFTPTGTTWPASSVNARIPPIPSLDASGNSITNKKGDKVFLTAAQWLDQNKPVEQLTWAPGLPAIIRNKLMRDGGGGWQKHVGKSCFNLYHPPVVEPGDAAQAEKWIGHIERIYPAEATHIIRWLAHRVQFPGDKINHALLLGGTPGIGKDTLLVPVVYAIGSWNFREATPVQILDRFTDYLKAVILRVSETRDLGDSNRIAFYDHLKTYTAAPPDTLVVNEKHMRPYSIPNVLGVVLTSNYKVDGMYLPPDDRRVFAAWSESRKEDFEEGYWTELYRWYAEGGARHVAAYLRRLDITGFNPKAPPPRTEAWHAIVMHNAPYEERELNDVLDSLDRPNAVSLGAIQGEAKAGLSGSESLGLWIADRKNRRAVPARLERCGYTPLRNPYAEDGLWVIHGRRQAVYGKDAASITDRMVAARNL